MKHSEYKNLTGRLVNLAREADRTRALLTMPLSVTGNGDIVATSTPDQDGPTVEVNRAEIWRAVEAVDNDIAGLMGSLVDGFVEENQDRAKPTADCRGLIEAMAGFMSATSTPVPGWGALYDQTRQRTRDWMDQANTWFPDLNDNQEPGQESRPTSTTRPGRGKTVTVSVDRNRLARFFNEDFRNNKRPGQQNSRFDQFYYATQTAPFTKTDWGRVAYAIKWNHRIVADNVRFMDFTPWLVEFFGAIGVEPPKDKRQNKYEDQGGTRDFINQWLK